MNIDREGPGWKWRSLDWGCSIGKSKRSVEVQSLRLVWVKKTIWSCFRWKSLLEKVYLLWLTSWLKQVYQPTIISSWSKSTISGASSAPPSNLWSALYYQRSGHVTELKSEDRLLAQNTNFSNCLYIMKLEVLGAIRVKSCKRCFTFNPMACGLFTIFQDV